MKHNILNKIKTKLKYTQFFYSYLRIRLVWVAIIGIIIGIFDGLGLSMFLPILQFAGGENKIDPVETGHLQLFFKMLQALGLELNLYVCLVFLCFFFLLKGIIVYLGNAYRITIQQYFVRRIRFDTLDLISGINFKSFVNLNIGKIQNTMTGEISRLSLSLTSYLFTIQYSILVLVYIGFAVIINPQFSIIVSLGGIISNIFLRRILQVTQKFSKLLTNESHEYQGLIIQFISNFKYLKATGLIPVIYNKLGDQISRIEVNNRKIGMLSAILSAIREPIMIIIVSIAIFIQLSLIGGKLSDLMISLLFFFRALSSLVSVQAQWNSFLAVSGSMNNIIEVQSELRGCQEKKRPLLSKKKWNSIELKNTSLMYDDKAVLKNINLKINRNETIAIIGESGSGKTSLLNIISRLVEPNSGSYLLDNDDILNLDPTTFQKRIGYITQEPIIFNTSIFNNITLWEKNNGKVNEKYNIVIKQAHISSFVNDYDKSGNIDLGINGINLSGGQKQRISIARELYKNIDILILDEATSSLDSETELIIQKNLDLLKGKITMIVVAHRLSTIKNVDRIVLLKNSEIQGVGNYTELLSQSADFKRMVKLQGLE